MKKTAIQQIIDIVEMDKSNGVEISMGVFLKMLKDGLKTEREQIWESFDAGSKRGGEIPFNAEQYYDQEFISILKRLVQ